MLNKDKQKVNVGFGTMAVREKKKINIDKTSLCRGGGLVITMNFFRTLFYSNEFWPALRGVLSWFMYVNFINFQYLKR